MNKQTTRIGKNRLVAAATGAAIALGATSASAETLRVVMQSGLRITDPIMTTAFITRDHGYMIYDTLLGVDSDFNVRPQMADWEVSEDEKTYTFTLRDGLAWHDGAPVTAEDCVASIKRWADIDSTAKPLMTMVDNIEVVDDKSFKVQLNTPTTLLLAGLSKMSSRAPFMMPKRIAETPASESIDEYVGSGPFVFVEEEFQPGIKVAYEKFEEYVPRDEPPSWTAGGKDVKVDRVEWLTMPDQMTAINALQSGEVDFIQQVPFDLLPLVENASDIDVNILDPLGAWTYFRMNWLHSPFDNKLVRQAAIAAVDQEDVMQALVGNPEYYRTCAAIMGCGNVNGDEYGKEWVVEGQIEKAKSLLEEAGYDDTPVVIMAPTDLAMVVPQPIVIGDALRKAGFNVQMKMMDWQTLAAQQGNQDAPSEGGWNIFSTYSILATSGDPFGNTPLSTDGRESWAGWPDVPEISELRLDYAKAASVEEQKEIAKRIQKIAIDEGVVGPLGQFRIPAAWSSEWSGFLESPITLFWNISKED
ncbi:ABC transporter substrate-binding protein [Pseudooceanicola batsensis HTCC2597]|uniref:ABC transporter substrate-binding protein n=1 Tax=Pseudooceanicola batsensis (strain ATCC BAA-863 / DSM 15984 / KCTC 12145 / HTCC2597) TaxID=252305 RepID=A3U1A0_PSEBH|nr:ABC transporter substrate-binding protein [Pseudooceanicola batsensis]EAQ02083.1 ABC transporter substrate-binding protein [Pseudooceanicola batsensis HTCC2597]